MRSELPRWFPVLLLLGGCGDVSTLPEGAIVVPGSAVEKMLNQCSRDAPAQGEATWQPTAPDVREFEAALVSDLPVQSSQVSWMAPSDREKLSRFPIGFERQYVGIIRKGKRYVYGDIGPKNEMSDFIRQTEEGPIITCDGGPVYFGAEYDVAAKRFTHWGFNGPLG